MPDHHLVLFGATGLTGGKALTYALEHPDVASVKTIGRRATGRTHPKLTEIVHGDFGDLAPIEAQLAGTTGLVFCLGAYTGSVPDDLFRKITVDFAVEAGRAVRTASPEASYCLLSGQGADREEKARASFARYKGMAENQLLAMGFPRLHIFRAGYIYPEEPREEPNFAYTLGRALWPLFRAISPSMGIPSRQLGSAMVHAAMHGTGPHTDPTLENPDILALAKRAGLAD